MIDTTSKFINVSWLIKVKFIICVWRKQLSYSGHGCPKLNQRKWIASKFHEFIKTYTMVKPYGISSSDKNEWVVTGFTRKISENHL